ncbi:hypothetical protein AVEN_87664-1 [Araneus ventricosus]|uniref:Uncharacterized protein n=1 Tax=Araneus ventricosus TaxID=182803 RepID=A0A4Y2H4S7_ARAVE|nr:hypothetical protein AVEN_87664-1 [Araneus ventricosus]
MPGSLIKHTRHRKAGKHEMQVTLYQPHKEQTSRLQQHMRCTGYSLSSLLSMACGCEKPRVSPGSYVWSIVGGIPTSRAVPMARGFAKSLGSA